MAIATPSGALLQRSSRNQLRQLLKLFSLMAVLWIGSLHQSAAASSIRYDLFARTYNGGGLYRIHGETGEILYLNNRLSGFFLTTGPDGAIYLPSGTRVDPRINDQCSDCISELEARFGVGAIAFGLDNAVYSAVSRWILRFPLEPDEPLSYFASTTRDFRPNSPTPSFEAILLGPNGDFYAGDKNGSAVHRFDGTNGYYLGIFASDDSLQDTRGMTFGPDGDLYVAGLASDNVVRFDGTTGAFDTVFASDIDLANGIAFGPNGDLFVAMESAKKIVRIDGTTGENLGDFATGLSGGLVSIAFAPVPIPEPTTVSMLSMVGILWLAKRRQRYRPSTALPCLDELVRQ